MTISSLPKRRQASFSFLIDSFCQATHVTTKSQPNETLKELLFAQALHLKGIGIALAEGDKGSRKSRGEALDEVRKLQPDLITDGVLPGRSRLKQMCSLFAPRAKEPEFSLDEGIPPAGNGHRLLAFSLRSCHQVSRSWYACGRTSLSPEPSGDLTRYMAR